MVGDRSGGLLSLGLLGALWAASTGMAAVINALNTAYDVEDGRPFWKARLVAIGLTISLSVFIVGGQVLIMFGDWLAMWLASLVGLGDTLVDYPIGLLLLTIGVSLIYHFAPNVKRKWRLITPGAIFAVVTSIIVSTLFSRHQKSRQC